MLTASEIHGFGFGTAIRARGWDVKVLRNPSTAETEAWLKRVNGLFLLVTRDHPEYSLTHTRRKTQRVAI